jgi:tetratricopeptide (TPR) repeat protein
MAEGEQPPEEEQGPPAATFYFTVGGVTGLPCELQTVVELGGICQEENGLKSQPAAASESPSAWEWETDSFTRLQDEALRDHLVNSFLVIKLLDVDAGNGEIGSTKVDLKDLLHTSTEVTGEYELTLTEPYMAKWHETEEPPPAVEGEEPPPPPPKKEIVPTRITITVRVDDCVGPPENKENWTALTFSIDGVFALPEQITKLGLAAGGDDVENHQLTYKAWLWGEEFSEGALARALEKEEPPADGEEGAAELSESDWRAKQEKYNLSVRFKDGERTRYRGKIFLNKFKNMLNKLGGVWLHFIPEVKPSTDPKKGVPEEVTNLAAYCKGKCWVDLRDFLSAGVKKTSLHCSMIHATPDEAQEFSFESAKTFVTVRTELLKEIVPLSKKEESIKPKDLIPPRERLQKFPSSKDASMMYVEALEKCLEILHTETSKSLGKEAPQVIEFLKSTGSYNEMMADLRSSVIRVFREKLKKNPSIIPGQKLEGEHRDQFFSDVYVFLKDEMCNALNEALKKTAQGTAKVQVVERTESQQAKVTLKNISDMSKRCASLAYEAEMVGNWDRAAKFFQSYMVIDENAKDPKAWLDYAQFLMRAGSRQGAAEEALQQGIMVLTTASAHREVDTEIRFMLAALLLDRERHEDAINKLTEWHTKDLTDPKVNFFLALSHFLNGETELASNLMQLVSKPGEWFRGLPDDACAFEKLKLFTANKEGSGEQSNMMLNTAPYVDCLQKLLTYGLPKLIFTFLDQVQALPRDVLDSESFVLVEAKSLILERNYEGAAEVLEKLQGTYGGQISQESWRLLGECYFQMQDFDKALASLNQALSFEEAFTDPSVYIRLGHVLLLKKRWKQARDAFLKSVRCRPTAEAWGGIAFAEYRSEDNDLCYEALCEANLLDNERSDIWAQLTLLHLRFENWSLADHCFRQCLLNNADSDELLLEIGIEYLKRDRPPTVAEAAARRALKIRDTGQAHDVLADALAKQEFYEKAILELQVAIRLLYDQPDIRRGIFEKALQLCQDLNDPPLAESIHIAQKLADQRLQEQMNTTQA